MEGFESTPLENGTRTASPVQVERARALLETTAWGDTIPATEGVAESLRYAMQLTRDEFVAWETEFDGDRIDEFEVPPQEARAMTPEWRLAHLARLVRSIAMNYGVDTDYGKSQPTGRLEPNSPAAVLAELAEISQHPPDWRDEWDEWYEWECAHDLDRDQHKRARGLDPRTAEAVCGATTVWVDPNSDVAVSDWVMREVWADLIPQWDELARAAENRAYHAR